MENKFQDKLNKVAIFFSQQRHICAIKDGLMITIPATIIGGLLLILANPPISENIEASNFFIDFLLNWKAWAIKNSTFIMIPQILTLGAISIYATIGISYHLSKSYDLNPVSNAINSLIIFLIIAAPPLSVIDGDPSTFMSTNFLDGKGIFTAMLVSIITVEIERILLEKGIKINMPESVPSNVSAPFNSLIPLTVSIIVVYGIQLIIQKFTNMSIPMAIMALMRPLVYAVDSYFGILSIVFFINLFWWFGLHGGAIVGALSNPFLAANLAENAAAYANGTPLNELPHIFAGAYTMAFANIGGFAATFSLTLLMLTKAKSSHLKNIGKFSIGPQIFNINEPVTFGIPLIFNTTMLIPIFIVPFINVTISYFLMSIGFINRVVVQAPWTTPGPILAFLSTFDIKAMILWFALLIIDMLVYYPFFKKLDMEKINEEVVKE